MDLKNLPQSKKIKYTIWAIAGLIVALAIFQIGIIVGFHKATFESQFGENYSRNFEDPRRGLDRSMMHNEMVGGHGTTGKIIKINLPNIIVSTTDNSEQPIVLNDKTIIREFHNTIPADNLKVGDFVVTIGAPDTKGDIQAIFIRVLPTNE